MVAGLVAGAMRVDHHDVQVGLVEREVIVSAIPEDDVGLGFRLAQDLFIVYAGVDDHAIVNVRLVFLALLDGTVVLVQIGIIGKTLYDLF